MTRWRTKTAARAFFSAALALALNSQATPIRRALVVAFNGTDQPATQPLRFADDDGYRWRETLERLGVETTLLTVPDADTARLESGRGAPVSPPTRKALSDAVAAIAERSLVDRAAGRTVDVFFVYIGHGQTDESGRAYLTVFDGRLDQQRLYAEVVDRLGADYVHLIIDACHAAGVVGSRGADLRLVAELKQTLALEHLKSRPHVGALFAESESGETHEWTRLRAGIFSHAARSGLLGAADVNRDGSIVYSELDAFVAAAIRGVKGTNARLSVKMSSPLMDSNRVLVGPAPQGPTLRVPLAENFSRLSVEDTDGVPLVDLNRGAGELVVLALPIRDAYWLRTGTGEARLSAGQLSASVTLSQKQTSARGGVEEAYSRGLFTMPFGRAFYEGYQVSVDVPALEFAPDAPRLGTDLPRGRFDGAWFGLGLSVGIPVTAAPLNATGLSAGSSVTLRTDGPWYVGARLQWTMAAGTLDSATVHRIAAGGMVGFRWWTSLAPFIELGPQWVPTLVVRESTLQGDLTGFGGRLAAGVHGSRDFLRGVRLSVSAELDAVRVDGVRRPSVVPGIEASMIF